MAIVINSSPVAYASMHGDLIFTVYNATNVAQPGYKYICDVYIGTTLVYRAKAFPNPVNNNGIFNIGAIVRNYIAQQFNPNNTIRCQEFGVNQFFLDVQCKFGEEFGGTLYTNLLVDSSRRYYNHYNGRLLNTQTILSNYLDKITSNRPYEGKVIYGDAFSFVPYFPTSISPFWVYLQSFTYGGGLINTQKTSFTPTAINNLQQLNLSPVAINSTFSNFIDATIGYYTAKIGSNVQWGLQERDAGGVYYDADFRIDNQAGNQLVVFNETTGSYMVNVGDSVTFAAGSAIAWGAAVYLQMRVLKNGIEVYNQTSTVQTAYSLTYVTTITAADVYIVQVRTELNTTPTIKAWPVLPTPVVSSYKFNIGCEPKFTNYVLHFLNQYGGFESYNFYKLSRKTYDIDKKDFTQLPYRMDGNGIVTWNNGSVLYDTKTIYASKYKEKIKLSTDLLTDAEYLWLKELLLSPIVYFQDGSFLAPVTITDNNYESKRFINDKLTALQVNIEFGEQYNAQYR